MIAKPSKKKKEISKPAYTSFSEFFLNASAEEKKTVILQAAKKANEDQRKAFEANSKAIRG